MDVLSFCLHDNQIDDISNGCTVCLSCGLVSSDMIFIGTEPANTPEEALSQTNYNSSQSKEEQEIYAWEQLAKNNLVTEPYGVKARNGKQTEKCYYSEEQRPMSKKRKLNESLEQLVKIGHNYHMSGPVLSCAQKEIRRIYDTHRKKGYSLCSNSLAAYALYFACQKHNVARSKSEIVNMFGVTCKSLNKIETMISKQESRIDILKPSDLLPRILLFNKYNISFYHQTQLGYLANKIFFNVCSTPNAVLGYVIYQFFNSEYFKHYYVKPKKKISMLQISNMCGITSSCIKRIVKDRGSINFYTQFPVSNEK